MWYQNILRREEFEAIYEPSVYAPTPSNPLTPHKLACVLMVLTLDTYLDITRLDEDPLVMEYWDGVQRCFDTRFGWGASIAGIQALALITLFVGFNYRGAGASTFYWLRQMTSAAQQVSYPYVCIAHYIAWTPQRPAAIPSRVRADLPPKSFPRALFTRLPDLDQPWPAYRHSTRTYRDQAAGRWEGSRQAKVRLHEECQDRRH